MQERLGWRVGGLPSVLGGVSGWQGPDHQCANGWQSTDCDGRYACGSGETDSGFQWVSFSGALPAIEPLDRLALRFDPVNGQGTVAVAKARWHNDHEMPGQWSGVHGSNDLYNGCEGMGHSNL